MKTFEKKEIKLKNVSAINHFSKSFFSLNCYLNIRHFCSIDCKILFNCTEMFHVNSYFINKIGPLSNYTFSLMDFETTKLHGITT